MIAMLTNLEERNRVKADQYWPEGDIASSLRARAEIEVLNAPEMYGKIEVTLLSTKQHRGFLVRALGLRRLRKTGEEESRMVHQLHYTEWPDFGAPESTEDMSALIRELDIHKKTLNEPIVVHCSAGIGRTGTFLAIHMILQDLNTSKRPPTSVDVFSTVLKLREQRQGMVQSKEQYKFVYATVRDVIAERIGLDDKRIQPRGLNRKQQADDLAGRTRVLTKSLQRIKLKTDQLDAVDEAPRTGSGFL